jgi:hypothetical protein
VSTTFNPELLQQSVALETAKRGLRPLEPLSPMQELQMQIVREGDVAKLEKLIALQERWEANEARKAFLESFAAFKSEAIRIVKNVTIKDGPLKGKMHADLFGIVDAVTPALSKHGLTLSWKLTKDEAAWMEVTATLRHDKGHAESVAMGGAPDTGPGRNAIQARGSAKTYLERYTATAILGMAAADQDTDGVTPASVESFMEEGAAADYLSLIEGSADVDELQRNYFKARDAAEAAKDKRALDSFSAAKNKMYLKLKRSK